ncbi:MAG TPA: DUF3307 domain-containing protein [Algoriphagus sp.]|nr:DUF3307 domain-containing protein [Algoriphagus sp.]
MILFLKLILAHLVGDFILQPKSWVAEKEQKKGKSPKVYFHFLIHGLLVLILLGKELWAMAVCITVIHGIIDLIKIYLQKDNNRQFWFFADQIAHLISLLLIGYIWFEPDLGQLDWITPQELWIFITAIVFVTQVSGIVIQFLLTGWSKDLNLSDETSLKNAGKYIGILERLFVFVFVISGRWEAIGFLLAAKSVFRFGDLRKSKDRKLTEYILIGTLLSFGIALATGIAVSLLLKIY